MVHIYLNAARSQFTSRLHTRNPSTSIGERKAILAELQEVTKY